MNKKGFTIIEIIICISLLVVVGVGSFISIKVISKKQLVDKLNMISTKASEAAQVYIETNKNASNQLYNNKNGVSLPLQLLVNEGYLSLEGTKLTNNDIKNQYVVTFLGGTGSTENCEQITSTNSWSNNQPIYLCMNSDGTGSNLAIIDPLKVSNTNSSITSSYYFKGTPGDNYVEHNGVKYRIYKIDGDDSLTLYSEADNSLSIDKATVSKYSVTDSDANNTLKDNVVIYNYNNCGNCYSYVYRIIDNGHEFTHNEKTITEYTYMTYYHSSSRYMYAPIGYLYKISKCVKLSNGDGTNNNPYKLDNSKCN